MSSRLRCRLRALTGPNAALREPMVYLRAFAHGSSGLASFFSSVATGGVPFYETMIIPLAVCTAVLAWSALPTRSAEWPKGFGRVMAPRLWLTPRPGVEASSLGAWTLCVAADRLQGPYVYALYEAFQATVPPWCARPTATARGRLLNSLWPASAPPCYPAAPRLEGCSGAMFSGFVGGLADRFGRKKGCVAYCPGPSSFIETLRGVGKGRNRLSLHPLLRHEALAGSLKGWRQNPGCKEELQYPHAGPCDWRRVEMMLHLVTPGFATSLLFSCFECGPAWSSRDLGARTAAQSAQVGWSRSIRCGTSSVRTC